MKRAHTAFSLLELLIVLALIGILVKLGVPSYRQFRCRSDWQVVKGNLYSLASDLEAFYLTQHNYKLAPIDRLANKLPKTKYYRITWQLDKDAYTLTASPLARNITQKLILQHNGRRSCSDGTQQCWEECK